MISLQKFEEACRIFTTRRKEHFEQAANTIVEAAKSPLELGQIAFLAQSIAQSGNTVKLPSDLGKYIDVPSTGGPASLSTLLCPILLGDTGLFVPKLAVSGSVAGGIDTMALIPGFNSKLAGDEFVETLRRVNIAHAEPSEMFCPADHSLIKARRAHQMMANGALAAASLLGKKLALPGTAALFDFRVGPEGNIGKDIHEAEKTEKLFLDVASSLEINVAIMKTDNRTFLCSALGRLESLDLLWRILNNSHDLLGLDKIHFETCCALVSRARRLAGGQLDSVSSNKELVELLSSGSLLKFFKLHVEAQGGTFEGIAKVLDIYALQHKVEITSPDRGFWHPPDVTVAKKWVKLEQRHAEEFRRLTNDPTVQVGLRLLHTPGDFVERGEPVVEIRYPFGFSPSNIPSGLAGKTTENPPAAIVQIFGS